MSCRRCFSLRYVPLHPAASPRPSCNAIPNQASGVRDQESGSGQKGIARKPPVLEAMRLSFGCYSLLELDVRGFRPSSLLHPCARVAAPFGLVEPMGTKFEDFLKEKKIDVRRIL